MQRLESLVVFTSNLPFPVLLHEIPGITVDVHQPAHVTSYIRQLINSITIFECVMEFGLRICQDPSPESERVGDRVTGFRVVSRDNV